MSKATEYVERCRIVQKECDLAFDDRRAVYKTTPTFSYDRLTDGATPRVAARVGPDGSLYLSSGLPADKVADFVKWLGEVYGD